MGDLIPLAEYRATRDAIRFQTCPDCPHRAGCEAARDGLWCVDQPEPNLRLRSLGPPDIIA